MNIEEISQLTLDDVPIVKSDTKNEDPKILKLGLLLRRLKYV